MTEMTRCGNPESLIAFVYDECELEERESIAAHLAMCASCAEEIQSLRDTRAHLGAWSPPALPLGFQITRTEAESPTLAPGATGGRPGKVLRPAAFWSRPLPAWAQVAAAALIFAAGMSVNVVRSSGEEPARVASAPNATRPVAVTAPRPASDFAVTRAEFARLDARLRAMENADVARASYAPRNTAAGNTAAFDTDVLARVTALEQRVARGERENVGNFARLAVAVEGARHELETNREAAERVNVMESELEQHKQFLRSIGPAVTRVAFTNGR
jgi:hypothetical protein